MKVIVNDANLLIDLVELKILPYFFKLDIEFRTTELILDELIEEQQEALLPYIETGRLLIEKLTEEELVEIAIIQASKTKLSEQDCSACYQALKHKATLITSDNLLRKFAKSKNIDVHGHLWVILNYLRHFHNVSWEEFIEYNQDIEIIHSEIEEKLGYILKGKSEKFNDYERNLIPSTYFQLIFVFASVINEIQNGPVSQTHLNIAKKLNPEDIVITFNWDTLMDRALYEKTNWSPATGYFISPSKIYRDEWIIPKIEKKSEFPLILKLHGSTNWLSVLALKTML